jgi:hypothetical protein
MINKILLNIFPEVFRNFEGFGVDSASNPWAGWEGENREGNNKSYWFYYCIGFLLPFSFCVPLKLKWKLLGEIYDFEFMYNFQVMPFPCHALLSLVLLFIELCF